MDFSNILYNKSRLGIFIKIILISVSMFIFAYNIKFGQGSILLLYMMWMPFFVFYQNEFKSLIFKSWPIYSFSLFLIFSTFYSDYPLVTIRIAIQYMIFVSISIIIAISSREDAICYGVSLGSFVVVLYSFAYGSYNFDPVDGSYTFTGAFDSKNQLGLFSCVSIVFAYASLIHGKKSVSNVIISALNIPISAYALIHSKSATSMLSCFLAMILLIYVNIVNNYNKSERKAVYITTIVLVFIVLIVLKAGLLDYILQIFGKDSTLTGRTVLWQIGMSEFYTRPATGVGFAAYWVHGRSMAEAIWSEFYIPERAGFHFHNTYIEILVEVGAFGMILFLIFSISWLLRTMRYVITTSSAFAGIAVSVFFMAYFRSFVEVEMISPYSVMLFLSILTYTKISTD